MVKKSPHRRPPKKVPKPGKVSRPNPKHPKPSKFQSSGRRTSQGRTKAITSKGFSFFPQAHASSTQTSSTAGKFNPPGWTGQQDYGFSTQGVPSTKVTTGFGGTPKQKWHKTQKGKLGEAIAASKKQHPQAWMTATGPKGLQQPPRADTGFGGITQVVQKTSMTAVKKVKTGARTWYATNAQGQTIKGEGKLSMQARQFYGDKGYNLITSKPPGQSDQQRLSDTTGITTYTKWGDVSTIPRDLAGQKPNKIRAEQQKLSDKYNITTYNKDGSVSTVPRQQSQLAQDGIQQVGGSDNAWWWDSPFSASAETDKKEKPWGWW